MQKVVIGEGRLNRGDDVVSLLQDGDSHSDNKQHIKGHISRGAADPRGSQASASADCMGPQCRIYASKKHTLHFFPLLFWRCSTSEYCALVDQFRRPVFHSAQGSPTVSWSLPRRVPVVYNLPMVRPLYSALGVIALFSVCEISSGQTPASGAAVSIAVRPAPRVDLNADAVPNEHLRVDASMVLVPVHAVSASGTNVTDLAAADFRVFEDGVEQEVTYFAQDDAPLSVGLVFDSSGSMGNKIRKSASAAAAFFKTANAGDEFFLVEFGERPKLITPFTSDSDEVYQKIAHTRPFGRTSLIDAIHLALIQMKNARNARKVIVILSDGGDNRSRLTRGEIKGALSESDVQLYAMGIFDAGDLLKHSREEQNGPRLLDELAEHTGGRVYTIDNLDDLESISSRLGNVLRSEYVLGYMPSNPSRDGKYRHIKVDLTVSSRTPVPSISYRRGYYAPVE